MLLTSQLKEITETGTFFAVSTVLCENSLVIMNHILLVQLKTE